MRKAKNKLSSALIRELIALFVILIILLGLFFYLLFPSRQEDPERIAEITSIKLVLLNGCGYSGLANEVKESLLRNEDSLFDILAWENVERGLFIYGKSLIVVKKDDKEKLEYLMKKTGIRRRIYATNESSLEDFQIILGSDYKLYFPQE